MTWWTGMSPASQVLVVLLAVPGGMWILMPLAFWACNMFGW